MSAKTSRRAYFFADGTCALKGTRYAPDGAATLGDTITVSPANASKLEAFDFRS